MGFRLQSLLPLLLAPVFGSAQPDLVYYPLPDSFVHALTARPDPGGSDLTAWFNRLTGDTLEGSYCHALRADLDEDPDTEVLLLLGGSSSYSNFCVIDRQAERWVMIFLAPVAHHYSGLAIQVMSHPVPCRLFGLLMHEERGSGVFRDAWYGFRLIGGKVYPVMRVPHTARILGWGLNLNQICTADLTWQGWGDRWRVTCQYQFFPGPWLPGSLPWEGSPGRTLISGSGYYELEWDSAAHQYRPAFSDEAFTRTQWLAFETFGSDSLFLAGFGAQLLEGMETGTRAHRRLVKAYLRQAASGSPGLTQLGETESGMKFYGPSPGRRRKR